MRRLRPRLISAVLALSAIGLGSTRAWAAPPAEDPTPVDDSTAVDDPASVDDAAQPEDPDADPDPAPVDDPAPVEVVAPDVEPGHHTEGPSDVGPGEDIPVDPELVPAMPDVEDLTPPLPTITEPEPEPEPEPDSHHSEEQAPHPPNPKIPPIGTTQPWFRSTTFVDYFGNNYNTQRNDDRFVALVNYINVGTDSRFKKWSLSTMLRVDTHNIFNTKNQSMCDIDGDGEVSSAESESCRYDNDYRIERFMVKASHKYIDVTAGDFNINFGRGIGLSIRKIADIGVDATIKGGKVEIKTKPVTLTAIGGVTNRQQTDFATRTLFDDPGYPHGLCERTPALTRNRYGNPFWTMCSDIVGGGRLDTKLPGKVRVGAHYVFLWFGERVGTQHEGMHVVGGDIGRKRIGKHWDLFGGVTGLLRNFHLRNELPGLAQNGLAAYLSNSLTFGDTFVLLEGKYYDNYVVAKDPSATTVQYAEAATLERMDQIIPAAANTAGGRLLVEHTLKKSRVTLYGNYLLYAFGITNDQDIFGRETGEMVHHGYVGLRWRDPEKGAEVQASGGYRWEGFHVAPDNHATGLPYTRKLPHAELYINQVVGKTKGMAHSVSLRVDWRLEKIQKGIGAKFFHRGNAVLGYGLSPWFTFAFIGGFSSEFAPVVGEPQLHPQPCDDENNCARKPHLWPGAEVRINFLESSFLRVFAGRQVGGLLCVNGSCRMLPDFEGVRADLILNF